MQFLLFSCLLLGALKSSLALLDCKDAPKTDIDLDKVDGPFSKWLILYDSLINDTCFTYTWETLFNNSFVGRETISNGEVTFEMIASRSGTGDVNTKTQFPASEQDSSVQNWRGFSHVRHGGSTCACYYLCNPNGVSAKEAVCTGKRFSDKALCKVESDTMSNMFKIDGFMADVYPPSCPEGRH